MFAILIVLFIVGVACMIAGRDRSGTVEIIVRRKEEDDA